MRNWELVLQLMIGNTAQDRQRGFSRIYSKKKEGSYEPPWENTAKLPPAASEQVRSIVRLYGYQTIPLPGVSRSVFHVFYPGFQPDLRHASAAPDKIPEPRHNPAW